MWKQNKSGVIRVSKAPPNTAKLRQLGSNTERRLTFYVSADYEDMKGVKKILLLELEGRYSIQLSYRRINFFCL